MATTQCFREKKERGELILMINIKREEGFACVLCGFAVSASATIPVISL